MDGSRASGSTGKTLSFPNRFVFRLSTPFCQGCQNPRDNDRDRQAQCGGRPSGRDVKRQNVRGPDFPGSGQLKKVSFRGLGSGLLWPVGAFGVPPSGGSAIICAPSRLKAELRTALPASCAPKAAHYLGLTGVTLCVIISIVGSCKSLRSMRWGEDGSLTIESALSVGRCPFRRRGDAMADRGPY